MITKDICSICLESIADNQMKLLSCGHKIHYKCYMKLVFHKNLFIDCPLCRSINLNITKISNNPRENIFQIISNKTKENKMSRCNCTTKEGKRCKNPSVLLNYGMCTKHHSSILKKEYYPLMEKYMYIILSQKNSWLSKIYLFDIGKKIIIKYCNEESTLDEILIRFYEYTSIQEGKKDLFIYNFNKIYEYHDLKKPELKWLNECKEKYIFY
tara:strand:+ start:1008 stop:1643 length:636 start_codon:yes stop_codon:yes gene_type:complete